MKVMLQPRKSSPESIDTADVVSLNGSILSYKKKIEKTDPKTNKIKFIAGPAVEVELDDASANYCKKNKIGAGK